MVSAERRAGEKLRLQVRAALETPMCPSADIGRPLRRRIDLIRALPNLERGLARPPHEDAIRYQLGIDGGDHLL